MREGRITLVCITIWNRVPVGPVSGDVSDDQSILISRYPLILLTMGHDVISGDFLAENSGPLLFGLVLDVCSLSLRFGHLTLFTMR